MPGSAFLRFLSYNGSSTKCLIAYDRQGYRKWRDPPRGFPWVCTCATGSYAISILVVPFYRKWRYKRHPVVTECHVTSFRAPLGARMRNRKLRNIRPSGAFWPEGCSLGLPRHISSMATGTSPFTGYLSLLFSYNIIYFNKVLTYGAFG